MLATKLKFIISIACSSIVLLLVSCTSKSQLFTTCSIVSVGKIEIYEDYNHEAISSKFYDSIYTIQTKQKLISINLKTGKKSVFNKFFVVRHNKYSFGYFVSDSIFLHVMPITLVESDHNSLIRINDLSNKKRYSFNFTGAPVTYYDSTTSKWINNMYGKDANELDFSEWNFDLDLSDTSITVALLKFIEAEKMPNYKKNDKLLIGKVSLKRQTILKPAAIPTWQVYKFEDLSPFAATNMWMNDSIMIYGFKVQSNLYKYNSKTMKSEEIPVHYLLMPDVISADTNTDFYLFNYHSHYSYLYKNIGGDGFFRLACTSSKKLFQPQPVVEDGGNSILFWHKNSGEIIETVLPKEIAGISHVVSDTLYCYKSEEPLAPHGPFTLHKYILTSPRKTTLVEYIHAINKK